MYFPDAIKAVAKCSLQGNIQHHPDKPLHWDKDKSNDHLDALTRHLMDAGTLDDDPQVKPTHNIFYANKAPWFEEVGDLKKYKELSTKEH